MAILWDFFSVFPADAGMIPYLETETKLPVGVPRGCGDDPSCCVIAATNAKCSPRMRG